MNWVKNVKQNICNDTLTYQEYVDVFCFGFCMIFIVTPLTFKWWFLYAHIAWRKRGECNDVYYYFNWVENVKQNIRNDTLTYDAYVDVMFCWSCYPLHYQTTHFNMLNTLCAHDTIKKWWVRWWLLLFQLKIKRKTKYSQRYSYLSSISRSISSIVLVALASSNNLYSHH